MNDKKEHRRLRLIELLQMTYKGARGHQTQAAMRIGCDQNYLSRLLSPPDRKGHKNIGEEYQDRIEDGFNLQPGWLDMPLGTPIISRQSKAAIPATYGPEAQGQATTIVSDVKPEPKNQELETAIKTLRALDHDSQMQVIGMIRLLHHSTRTTEASAGLHPPAQAA